MARFPMTCSTNHPSTAMLRPRHTPLGTLSLVAMCVLLLALESCGGGSGASSPPPPPVPDFAISVSPQQITIAPGGSGIVHVGILALNGFSGQVSVSVLGLPSGVTISPNSPFIVTTNGLDVTLSVGGGVVQISYTLMFQGTSGSTSHTAQQTLNVGQVTVNFSLSTIFPRMAAYPGQSTSTTILVTGDGGLQVQLSAVGLPQGTMAAFSPSTVLTGSAAQMTITAASNAPTASNVPVTIIGTNPGTGIQRTTKIFLYVALPPGGLPGNRSAYVATDGTPESAVYDGAHQVIFSANTSQNRVEVISLPSRSVVASIPAPNPWGLDLSLDGKQVLVGTRSQQLTIIDTATLHISKRVSFPAPPPVSPPPVGNPPKFIAPFWPASLANGKVFFLAALDFVNQILVEWDPIANTTTQRRDLGSFGPCFMARSGDGSRVILSGCDSGGALAIYDTGTNQFKTKSFNGNFIFEIAANPNGTQFAVVADFGFVIFDQNLNQIARIPLGGLFSGILFSRDGKKLYAVTAPFFSSSGGSNDTAQIFGIDTTSFAILGAAPAMGTVRPTEVRFPSFIVEQPMAEDGTGIIIGVADHGICLDDATYIQNLPPNLSEPDLAKFLSVDEGPVGGGTNINIGNNAFPYAPDIWFGATRGLTPTVTSSGVPVITSPAAPSAGPATLKLMFPDGIVSWVLNGFSYGTQPVEFSAIAASPTGGTTVHIFGYGLAADQGIAAAQVTVGNQAATVTAATRYQSGPFGGYPYPLHDLTVTAPPGSPGQANISVTTSAGSGTAAGAFRYLQSVRDFASADAFNTILYDRFRQQIYLGAGTRVDVFSLTTQQFRAPIAPPSVGGSAQVSGLALTPDGSKLLVSNFTDSSVAMLDPTNPSAGTVFPVPHDTFLQNGPQRLAATSNGNVFIEMGTSKVIGGGGTLLELNLTTGAVTKRTDPGLTFLAVEGYFLAGSREGTRACIGVPTSGGGFVYFWDVGTDTWAGQQIVADLVDGAIAGDGNSCSVGLALLDSQVSLRLRMRGPEFYPLVDQRLQGHKLHDSGSLLYSPFPRGLDIFDAQHGDLRERIYLSEQIPRIQDAMAIDETGQRIFAITDKGLTIITMDSVPLSVGSLSVPAGPATGGTQLTVRGSGFQPGAIMMFGDASASTSVLNSNTLQVTTPSMMPGPVRVTVKNPDGASYSLDAAFVAQ